VSTPAQPLPMDLLHTIMAVAIFALTYALLAVPRTRWLPLGRPGAALLGATLMVAAGVLDPVTAVAAVHLDTLLLLFGMMLLAGAVEEDGALAALDQWALRRAQGSPRRLLALVGITAATLSAVLVNDTVCVFLTPLVLRMCQRAGLAPMPYLLMLATAANIGSAATLVGNPQNMLIGALSGLSFGAFVLRAGPAVIVALLVHLALVDRLTKAALPQGFTCAFVDPPAQKRLGVVVLMAVAVALVAGLPMGWAATAGGLSLTVLRRRSPDRALRAVDWPLLVLFAGLFIVVEGLRATGLVALAMATVAPLLHLGTAPGAIGLAATLTAGSNVISNVPMVMLIGPEVPALGPADLAWPAIALITTFAGNLTLVGSVANLIVAEAAAPTVAIDFGAYLRIGVPATLCSMLVGLPVLWLTFSILTTH
jgi:Na+/H+ antiporter NhaD/arsenite permease-like protein